MILKLPIEIKIPDLFLTNQKISLCSKTSAVKNFNMQDKFGKKLEEARVRRGISIRQASDDLKIRADFLLSFENDHGNFDMPMVYKVGFIKLYARYLKLDIEEIAADFNAFNQNDGRKNRQKEEREHLGRIELISAEPPVILNTNADFNDYEEVEECPTKKSHQTLNLLEWAKNPYVRTGAFFGGSLVALTAIAIIINNLIQPSATETEALRITQAELANSIQHVAEQLVLLGEDNIHVVVRQEQDKQRLFAGNIDKGHPVTIMRKGPVKIHFSDGSKFSIQQANGKTISPGRTGMGWIEI